MVTPSPSPYIILTILLFIIMVLIVPWDLVLVSFGDLANHLILQSLPCTPCCDWTYQQLSAILACVLVISQVTLKPRTNPIFEQVPNLGI